MGRLQRLVVLITPAQSGLGDGIAARLRAEDATVIAVNPPADRPQADRAVAEVLRAHGRLDILVNAGSEDAAFAPLEHKAQAIDASAQAVLWMMQAAFPALRGKGGRIVNVVAAFGDSLHRQVADHVAAGEAIKSLTRSAAEEWGRHGVLVNALAAAADTAAFRRLRERSPAAVDALVAGSPMGRMGDPVADIGGAVLLLVGEAGRFLTGHVLHADGGQHLTPTPYEALVPLD